MGGDRRTSLRPHVPLHPLPPNPPADAAPHEPEAGLADFAAAPRSPARTASGVHHSLSGAH